MGSVIGALPGVGSMVEGKGLGGSVVNSALDGMGLGGEQGQYFQNQNQNNAQDILNQYANGMGNQATQSDISGYANGDSSLFGPGGLINSMGNNGAESQAFQNQLATDPRSGLKYATDQIQNNSMLSPMFGQNGELNNSINTEQQLQNQGYNLTPQDQTAYGQAAQGIGAQFQQAGNDMSANLASRGLASAPNGATGALYSGLQGTQNEQLAAAQQNIAQQRMQTTMQRIGQQQNFISQLGTQQQNAINSQYSRQLQGAQNYTNTLGGISQQAVGQNNSANSGALNSQEDERKAAGKTLEGALGQGLYNGVAGGSAAGVSNGASSGFGMGSMGGAGGAAGATPGVAAAPAALPGAASASSAAMFA